jgi:hypothetical protein
MKYDKSVSHLSNAPKTKGASFIEVFENQSMRLSCALSLRGIAALGLVFTSF